MQIVARTHLPLRSGSVAMPTAGTTALLQACRDLSLAGDPDAIATAAAALLGQVLPDAVVTRHTTEALSPAASRNIAATTHVRLSAHATLEIALPANRTDDALAQAAVALVQARVDALGRQGKLSESVDRLRRSERLQHALYAIANQASSAGTDLAPMFEALHAIVGTLMYAENFYIALYDAKRDSVWFPYFADSIDPTPQFDASGQPHVKTSPGPVWPLAEIARGPTWYLIRNGKPLMGPPEAMAQQVDGPFELSGAPCKDFLGVPLINGKEVVGCVAVQSYDETHQYDEQDKALLVYMAQHVQTALERRRAHAELEHRVADRTVALSKANEGLQREVLERQRGERLQSALFRIAQLASTTSDMGEFYATVHHVVAELLYARNFYIALLSEDGSELTFPYLVDEFDEDGRSRKLGNGMTELVIHKGEVVLAGTQEIERICANNGMVHRGPTPVCWIGVPMAFGGNIVGVLAIQSYSPEHRYTARDQELLTFVSYHIAHALERVRAAESLREANTRLEKRVAARTRALALANRDLRSQITERERIEARLKYETLHDSLTGLPNRTLLMRRLERALQLREADPAQGFAVLFMDLDRFKVINDSVGHMIGDALLVEVGSRVRECLKECDTVARLGGDEFSILLENVSDIGAARQVAERIIDELNVPFRLAGKELFTSASIGITLAATQYHNADELLRDADSAMYRAKADGRHRVVLFDENVHKKAVSLLEVENDLRRGLTRNEFIPYYQPIVDLATGDVLGYEALMRWQHPQRGLLLPGAFLDVAEDTGVSEIMDWQIFTQVCRDANALTAEHDRFVAINLSPRHFRDPQFDARLLDLLALYNVPASRVHIEVTEGMLLQNTPTVKRILQTLRKAGFNISLDDFGTGYSSLSYLHKYPLQTLKIDRSFVANLTTSAEESNDAVIRAILAMARTLGIKVIAEGVETAEQRDLLYTLGCRNVQGFLYAKAQPVGTWTDADVPSFGGAVIGPSAVPALSVD